MFLEFSQQPGADRKTQTCLLAQQERCRIGVTRNMLSTGFLSEPVWNDRER
jgi:hypothetical protein